VSREITEHIWDEHYDPFSNVVDVYVQRLLRTLVSRPRIVDSDPPRRRLSTHGSNETT
jgi:DNA-binding response OmpR family regulator